MHFNSIGASCKIESSITSNLNSSFQMGLSLFLHVLVRWMWSSNLISTYASVDASVELLLLSTAGRSLPRSILILTKDGICIEVKDGKSSGSLLCCDGIHWMERVKETRCVRADRLKVYFIIMNTKYNKQFQTNYHTKYYRFVFSLSLHTLPEPHMTVVLIHQRERRKLVVLVRDQDSSRSREGWCRWGSVILLPRVRSSGKISWCFVVPVGNRRGRDTNVALFDVFDALSRAGAAWRCGRQVCVAGGLLRKLTISVRGRV